jgi:hypothetical protein
MCERHQFRHIRNEELRPHVLHTGARVVVYHLFVLNGLFSLRDLGQFYRHWAARAVELVLPQRKGREHNAGWPLGRQQPK